MGRIIELLNGQVSGFYGEFVDAFFMGVQEKGLSAGAIVRLMRPRGQETLAKMVDTMQKDWAVDKIKVSKTGRYQTEGGFVGGFMTAFLNQVYRQNVRYSAVLRLATPAGRETLHKMLEIAQADWQIEHAKFLYPRRSSRETFVPSGE